MSILISETHTVARICVPRISLEVMVDVNATYKELIELFPEGAFYQILFMKILNESVIKCY